LSKRTILVSTLIYGFAAFAQLIANEIFPLWVVTSVRDGGLASGPHNIGIAIMISGPIIIAMQIGVYPYLVERYGVLKIFRVGCSLFAIACILMPCVSLLPAHMASRAPGSDTAGSANGGGIDGGSDGTSGGGGIDTGSGSLGSNGGGVSASSSGVPSGVVNNAVSIGSDFTWFFVVAALSVIGTSAMWVFTSVFVFINNSCYSHERATVNGIGQTCASFGRFTGPYIGATLFAWSENNGFLWPFNYYLTWYVIALVSIGNSYLSRLLPRSIERRKREPREPRYALTMRGAASNDDNNGVGNEYDETNTIPLLSNNGMNNNSPRSSRRGSRDKSGRRSSRKDKVKGPTDMTIGLLNRDEARSTEGLPDDSPTTALIGVAGGTDNNGRTRAKKRDDDEKEAATSEDELNDAGKSPV
jgi:MFS family permease